MDVVAGSTEASPAHRPAVKTFFHLSTGSATHVLFDPDERVAAAVDPVLDFDPATGRIGPAPADALLDWLSIEGLSLQYVLETHLHADHLTAADYLRRRTGAIVVAGDGLWAQWPRWARAFDLADLSPAGHFDVLVTEGDRLALGGLSLGVLHTPGHTPESVTYACGDALFVGDTLFMPDVGTARADFPGGDARALFRSIVRILESPLETRIFVGHDYPPEPRTVLAAETTTAAQIAGNIHVGAGVGEAQFVNFRTTRDAALAPPAALPFALQVNLCAGALPPPTPAGQVFLRLPVAWTGR